MPPLTGLEDLSTRPFTHGFAVGYMTAPATRAFPHDRRCGRIAFWQAEVDTRRRDESDARRSFHICFGVTSPHVRQ